MAYNDYMYAIDRSDEYLAHYGVKGMKWGVRKALERGNTKSLMRHYRKAQRKLAKLEARAANGKKYKRRAIALGAGAVAAGGLAAAGTGGIQSGVNKAVEGYRKLSEKLGDASDQLLATGHERLGNAAYYASQAANFGRGSGIGTAATNAANAVGEWGRQRGTIAKAIGNSSAVKRINENAAKNGPFNMYIPTNDSVARAGAGLAAAGLAAGAGYNAYRAATTKRAARKAAEFRNEMNNTFQNTGVERMARNANKKRRKR